MTYDFTLPAGTDPHRLAATISTFGIAHIPGHLSPAVAQTVAAQSRALLDATAPWVTQLEYSVGRSVRADSVGLAEVTEFAALSGVFTDPYLKSAADAFMAPTTYLFHHDLYVAYDVEGSHHFAHALHYDRVPHLKFLSTSPPSPPRPGPCCACRTAITSPPKPKPTTAAPASSRRKNRPGSSQPSTKTAECRSSEQPERSSPSPATSYTAPRTSWPASGSSYATGALNPGTSKRYNAQRH